MIGVAAHERVDGRAVLGIDDENASCRRLAVIRDKGAGSDHVNVVAFGLIEMYPVRTIEFGAGRHSIGLIDGVDHK